MTDRELMQQALEALEAIPEDVEGYMPEALTNVVIALRERLARQEQEPVACSVCNQVHLILDADESQIIRNAKDGYPEGRTPQVLTLQERVMALCLYASDWKRWCLERENTAPQPAQQEPVAWQVMVEDEAMKEFSTKDIAHDWCVQQKLSGSSYTYWIRPLYTRPQAREPLPCEKLRELWCDAVLANNGSGWFVVSEAFARAIEAAHGIGEKK